MTKAPLDVELHQPLGHELHHLAQHVDVGSFSANSVNAIVGVVIVEISLDRLVGRTSTISGTTMATPIGIAVAHAASRFGLRPTRLAASKDLHHFLGHQQREPRQIIARAPLVRDEGNVRQPALPAHPICRRSASSQGSHVSTARRAAKAFLPRAERPADTRLPRASPGWRP